jgi:hypothetical protein
MLQMPLTIGRDQSDHDEIEAEFERDVIGRRL